MSDKKQRILWPLLVIVGLALCVATAVALRAHAATVNASTEATSPAPLPIPTGIQRAQARERLGFELISVTRFGMEPAEIQRVGGHFFLSVENQTRAQDIVWRLEPEQGVRVREVQQPNDEMDWTEELNLPPGRYVLTEANHPRWVCHINIQSR